MNLFYHFVATILSNTSPVPTGIMAPCLGMGVMLGRFYGHCFCTYLNWFDGDYVRSFAFIGAGAVASAITRTTSIAIIVFELSGSLDFMPFVSVGVIFGYIVANFF